MDLAGPSRTARSKLGSQSRQEAQETPRRSTAIVKLSPPSTRRGLTGCSKRLARSSLGWTKPSCSRGRSRPRRKPSSRTTWSVARSYYRASGTSRWRLPLALIERSRLSRSCGRACCQGLAEARDACCGVRDGLPERWRLQVGTLRAHQPMDLLWYILLDRKIAHTTPYLSRAAPRSRQPRIDTTS